ncbi:MAG: DUF817 domain-containing protein [Trueperaceae bacterium]|nr:DUF817 domain-containing protein [Trueperaceae bacterium]
MRVADHLLLPAHARIAPFAVELLHFGLKNARACVFPVYIFAMLALSQVAPLPIARYDFLLLACLGMQALMLATGLETRDELKVITLFHLLGLGLELFKVHVGSWSYPEDALFEVAGVPLYSGFMYASVASYMIQAWRHFALRFLRWPPTVLVAPLGALIYLNFFTHHALPDLRYVLIVAVLVVFGRTWVAFTPTTTTRGMPLVLAFLLIGVFVWFAENIATYLGAWQYPDQSDGWRMVSPAKLTSWSLLVIVSLMAVVQLKRLKGARPGQAQDVVEDGDVRPLPRTPHV